MFSEHVHILDERYQESKKGRCIIILMILVGGNINMTIVIIRTYTSLILSVPGPPCNHNMNEELEQDHSDSVSSLKSHLPVFLSLLWQASNGDFYMELTRSKSRSPGVFCG